MEGMNCHSPAARALPRNRTRGAPKAAPKAVPARSDRRSSAQPERSPEKDATKPTGQSAPADQPRGAKKKPPDFSILPRLTRPMIETP